ncbi:MAG: hypothetical protein IT294_02690 [Deltaproteobacteria bacterium]|nr:hypothetical protein [Deltaproteobacteria bacterium]
MPRIRAGDAGRKPKYLLYQRVIRALEELKIPEETFARVYATLPDIRVKMPTPEEVEAVERFMVDGDFQKLGERIGRKEPSSISVLVTRVLVLKARGNERIEREGWPSHRGRATAG